MRNSKAIFAVVLALAVHGVHAVTGPAAAELITSDPATVGYKAPDSVLMQFQRIDSGVFYAYDYSIGFDTIDDDVEKAFASLSGIITAKEAMLNAMKALAHVALLYESDKQLGKRIDALEKSAKNALAQVDKTEVIDEHGNQIESILKIIKKPGDEGETIEVTTEGTPVDKKSIDYTGMPTGPNKPAPLEIKGFGANANNPWLLPHPRDGAIHWGHVAMLADRKSIEATYGSTDVFSYTFSLKGWDTPTADAVKCDDALSSQLLTGDETHHVVTRLNNGTLHYTPVGKLSVMSPDDSTITTNAANGATETGKASLYGYNLESTGAGFIPSKGNDGGELTWLNPADMVDGTSLAQATTGSGTKVWEVKDAHSYAGAQARHYFGTGDDSALGWHELPNVTTNNVVGDEKTISSTFDQTGETKIFGLKGFPTSGTLLALACQGGDLLYIPFPAGGGTNLVAVDDVSVSSNTTGRLQLNGWETQGACSEKAAEILAGGEATAQSKHEIVTRYGGAGGSIHYLPFDVFPHPNTDDFSIDANTKAFTIRGEEGKYLCGTAQGGVEWKPTNGVDRASIVLAENVAALNGFAGADPGMMPFKDDGGKLAWREQAPVAVDRVSVVTNQDREITLNGFSVASDNAVPFKSNGVLVWGSVAAITNRIVAGAGINVTDNGEGTLTISAKALDTNGGTATYQTLTVVTSVQYNPSTHKFQCKTRQITFLGSAQAESGWTDVFEATSHKGEHQ